MILGNISGRNSISPTPGGVKSKFYERMKSVKEKEDVKEIGFQDRIPSAVLSDVQHGEISIDEKIGKYIMKSRVNNLKLI